MKAEESEDSNHRQKDDLTNEATNYDSLIQFNSKNIKWFQHNQQLVQKIMLLSFERVINIHKQSLQHYQEIEITTYPIPPGGETEEDDEVDQLQEQAS